MPAGVSGGGNAYDKLQLLYSLATAMGSLDPFPNAPVAVRLGAGDNYMGHLRLLRPNAPASITLGRSMSQVDNPKELANAVVALSLRELHVPAGLVPHFKPDSRDFSTLQRLT
eukprot:scaffold231457_cov27-Tisochrysis_lutea.AAC.1